MHCQTDEFHSKFRLENRYRTHHSRVVIHAISVFCMKFTVEFSSETMNFSTEESEEKYLIKQ